MPSKPIDIGENGTRKIRYDRLNRSLTSLHIEHEELSNQEQKNPNNLQHRVDRREIDRQIRHHKQQLKHEEMHLDPS